MYKTTKVLNQDLSERAMRPGEAVLCCVLFPVYNIYWFYKNVRKSSHLALDEGLLPDNPMLFPILAGLAMAPLASLLLQRQINQLAALEITGSENHKLHKCHECGIIYDVSMERCPGCGKEKQTPFYRQNWFAVLMSILYVVVMYLAITNGISTYRRAVNGQEYHQEQNAAASYANTNPYANYDDGFAPTDANDLVDEEETYSYRAYTTRE